jgi:anthranilate synthase component 2
MKPVLVIDNYDSFVYNLVHLIRDIDRREPVVVRNDKITVDEVAAFDRILLSPGPGVPAEAGVMPTVVRTLGASHRILGVCLGHQCIGEVYGATLENMSDVCHGKGVMTEVVSHDEPLFRGVPTRFISGRYHSWVVSPTGLPDSLVVTARDDQGRIMALRHREHDVRGVQFHPESVLTPDGRVMMTQWLMGGR